MYQYLFEISPEIKIFNFGYLSSGHTICEQGCKDLVIFPSQSHEQISLGATGLSHSGLDTAGAKLEHSMQKYLRHLAGGCRFQVYPFS